jgi:predicted ATPase
MIQKISIENFKSIKRLKDFELKPINVLIGANNSGKSNFLDAFMFLRDSVQSNSISNAINKRDWLGAIKFNRSEYLFISIGKDNFLREEDAEIKPARTFSLGGSTLETAANFRIYHFINLSEIRKRVEVHDEAILAENNGNLINVLISLCRTSSDFKERMNKRLSFVFPYFESLSFLTDADDLGHTYGVWKERGFQKTFNLKQVSDGVLRFLCLIAVLENPNPPSLICIDEPEVGMHPDAMGILAEMVRSAATRTQVILTTHSPQFLDFFAPEEIIIVEKEKDESTFKRLSDKPMLDKWLAEYGVGDLWMTGEAGGKMR